MNDVPAPRGATGFTIVELLVSTAVLALLSMMLIGVVQQTGSILQRTAGKAEQFREARAAFDTMTTRLAQATLNTYWDYDNPALPTKYRRRSELRFISGPASDLLGEPPANHQRLTHAVFFQAPLGFTGTARYHGYENLLCTWGYYLDVGSDEQLRPDFLTPQIIPLRYRPRLFELRQPTEENSIFKFTSGTSGRNYFGRDWFRQPLAGAMPPARPLAENIVTLLIIPRLAPADEAQVKGPVTADNADESPLAPKYLYDSAPVSMANPPDSRHLDPRLDPANQLPPLLQVTMIAVDEVSAERLGFDSAHADPLQLSKKFAMSRDYTRDLLLAGGQDSIESQLIARHANYRILTTNVVIRGAKWSREQAEAITP